MNITIEQIIEEAIIEHEYAGEGKCLCGTALGYSDGVAWTIFLEQHKAVEIVRSLEHYGYHIGKVSLL